MSNWVDVSERLPPLRSAVCLYNQETGDMWIGALCLYDSELIWSDSKSNFWWDAIARRWEGHFDIKDYHNPTHWSPLIPPPSKYPSADRVYP